MLWCHWCYWEKIAEDLSTEQAFCKCWWTVCHRHSPVIRHMMEGLASRIQYAWTVAEDVKHLSKCLPFRPVTNRQVLAVCLHCHQLLSLASAFSTDILNIKRLWNIKHRKQSPEYLASVYILEYCYCKQRHLGGNQSPHTCTRSHFSAQSVCQCASIGLQLTQHQSLECWSGVLYRPYAMCDLQSSLSFCALILIVSFHWCCKTKTENIKILYCTRDSLRVGQC